MDLRHYEREDHVTLWFSKFTVHQNHLEGLFKEKLLGPMPKVPNSARGNYEFIKSFQMTLLLLIWGPHFGDH